MTTETLRRRGRLARLLLAMQGAKGAMISDFTAGSALLGNIWFDRTELNFDREKNEPGPWMTTFQGEAATARYSLPERSFGRVDAIATPASIEMFLRSNWGPYAAGIFTLKSQINEFATLAWVEEATAGATQKLIRMPDVWMPAVTIVVDLDRGPIVLSAQFEGRGGIDIRDLNALAGVTLPAANMPPSSFAKFRAIASSLVRDPAGAATGIRFSRLEIELQQGVSSWYSNTAGWIVTKRGKTRARIRFTGNVSAETWTLLTNNRAGTKDRYRFTATCDPLPTAKTLTVDLYGVDFDLEPFGNVGRDGVDFRAEGQAHVTAGSFVTIGLA